jgi:hypothetical protein
MAETSLPWPDTATGDGTAGAGYSDDQWSDSWRKLLLHYRASRGVLKDYANELAATGGTSPVAINTGAAMVDGKLYENTVSVNVVIPTPAGSTRIDRIVLRKDFAGQTVRIFKIAGAEGTGVPPAITQTDGTTWDLPLCQVSITTGGIITLTDERRFQLLGVAHEQLTPEDGWVDRRDKETWVYASAITFTIAGVDATAKFRKGAKLRWKQGAGYKYAYVVSSSFGGGNTTVTVTGGSDYTVANAAITDNYISYVENPEGFPDWFNYAPSITGYSANPTNSIYRFCIKGRTVTILLTEVTPGTSNSVNTTYSLPVSAIGTANVNPTVKNTYATDNGAGVTTSMGTILAATPTLLSCYKTEVGGAWTGSGGKAFAAKGFEISYEMA